MTKLSPATQPSSTKQLSPKTDKSSLTSYPNKAVIYCRVSSAKQVSEGDGLGSQELSCRRYAAARGYEVIALFTDGVTGGTDERKGLLELLAFLGKQPPGIVVVIDDIKRFARDVELHFGLKRTIMDQGARLESPLFRFEDTPEGKFIETMMAAQAELERNQNKRQVFNRMQARLEQGFWVFNAQPGYTYQRHPMAKKLLVPNSQAPLVQEALEGFASGRFATAADVDRFLMSRGFFGTKKSYQGSRLTRIHNMLSSVVYAGWIEFPSWGITLRKGQHQGIISFETFTRIQERLKQRSSIRTERVKRNFYPLRGIVHCEGCSRRLTASHSRGRHGGYYDYYHCPHSECPLYGKGIPALKLESAFEDLLRPLELSEEQYRAVVKWLEDFSQTETKAAERRQQRLAEELAEVDKRIGELIETISKASSELVIRSLETKIEELMHTKEQILAHRHESSSQAEVNVGTLLEQVGQLLKNPLLVWQIGDTKIRHLLAQIAFSGIVVYYRETGFGTPDLSLPYRFFGTLAGRESGLVDPSVVFSNPEQAYLSTVLDRSSLVDRILAELVRWVALLTDHEAVPLATPCGNSEAPREQFHASWKQSLDSDLSPLGDPLLSGRVVPVCRPLALAGH